ncbi:glycosyltransferase [Parvularcula mediterranea]|uniref:glycosyltransferase n=1 Tax=Parvularcula mediterranea TaxID=2732508 RepID=UPI0018E96598|nr:glycosyltransferase family 2 protein [Parvularcula mediterranea]
MTKDHGLSGLFGEDGSIRVKDRKNDEPAPAVEEELPPVLEDADRSPLDMLADKIGMGDPEPTPPPAPPAPAPVAAKPEPTPEPKPAEVPANPLDAAMSGGEERRAAPEPADAEPQAYDPFAAAFAAGSMAASEQSERRAPDPAPVHTPEASTPPTERETVAPKLEPASMRPASAENGGILCFLVPSDNDRGRRRTLEAINVAAGNGAVRLRALPADPDAMDQVLEEAVSSAECDFVAFLSAGTEPADDWALECVRAFEEMPSAGAVTVRAANADPLSTWARVAFFMDEAERQKGRSRGFDTMVFRRSALNEIGEKLGFAVRNGRLVSAVEGRGHKIALATEARVSISTPSDRREVFRYIREQARLAARQSARQKNPVSRLFTALFILAGYPFRILAVRKAAKRSVGTTQFREVASKIAMAVFADRRVRATTMLFPGKDKR